jgi:WD40 repeat protein
VLLVSILSPIPHALVEAQSSRLELTLQRTLTGHHGPIESLALSPDGRRVALAVGSYVHLLRLGSGQLERTLVGHREVVTSVSWSRDGRILASASNDDTVRLWDASNGAALRVLTGVKGDMNTVSFSADGKRLATGGDDKLVRIWDVSNGRPGRVLRGSSSRVHGLAWRPDGRALAAVSDDGLVRVWDTVSGKVARALPAAAGGSRAVVFSNDGRLLASGGTDGMVRVWDLRSNAPRVFRGHSRTVQAVAFSQNGQQLASASFDRSVRLWGLRDGLSRQLIGHTDSVNALAFLPGAHLVTAGSDGVARVWELLRGVQVSSLSAFPSAAVALAWHPDSSRIASAANDTNITVFTRVGGAGQNWSGQNWSGQNWSGQNWSGQNWSGHTGWVRDLEWSRDGSRLASVGDEGLLIVWSQNAQKLHSLRSEDDWLSSVSWSPDGVHLAIAGVRGVIGIWNAQSGRLERELIGHSEAILSLAWSPNGQFIVSGGSDSTVKLWRARDGIEVYALKEFAEWTRAVVWSADSLRFAVASDDGLVSIWATASGTRLESFRHGLGFVSGLTWSADGQTLATGGDDGVVRLWNAASGTSMLALKQHTDWTEGLAFSPDGTGLAVGAGTIDHGGTVTLYAARDAADVFGQANESAGLIASGVGLGAEKTSDLTSDLIEIPSDYLPLQLLDLSARTSTAYRPVSVGDRIRLDRAGDDFTVMIRPIKVENFDPSRSSVLELALERARFECVFQTRAERCGDPVQIQAIQTRFGLEGYQIELTAFDRERPTDRLTATPFTPVIALELRAIVANNDKQPQVMLLIWLEARTPGAIVVDAESKLQAFLEGFALETAR